MVTVFLSRACSVLRSPLDPLHGAVCNFLLAKPQVDLFRVPEFLRLLHSSEAAPAGRAEAERRFSLRAARDGIRGGLDCALLRREHHFKLIMAFHDSALCSTGGEKSRDDAGSLIRYSINWETYHNCF